jgi:hypothetical protein
MQQDAGLTTIERLAQASIARQCEAASRYRELLRRNERPQPGDAEALAEVAGVLGRQVTDLGPDAALVAELGQLEDALAGLGDVIGLVKAAREELRTVQAWADSERAKVAAVTDSKLQAANAALRAAQAKRAAAGDTQTKVEMLKRRWATVVGEEPAVAPCRTPLPAPVRSRGEVLSDLARRFVEQRFRPVTGTVHRLVDRELAAVGLAPVTSAEWAESFGALGEPFGESIAPPVASPAAVETDDQ